MLLFVSNEIFTLHKVLISTMRSKDKNRETREISNVQSLVFLRVISSKLFEFIKLCGDQRKRWERQGSKTGKTLEKEYEELLRSKSSIYFQLAEEIRNKVSNHFLVSDICSYFMLAQKRDEYEYLLHQEQGNSVAPVGEDVVFFSLFNQFLRGDEIVQNIGDKAQFFEGWLDWISETTNHLDKFTYALLRQVLDEKLPQKKVREKRLFLDEDLVGDINSFRMPLILRNYQAN